MAAQPTDLPASKSLHLSNIQQLEVIEQQVAQCLQSAAQALTELSKDKPGGKHVENHCTSYMKALDAIEDGLSTHINYLTQCSTGQPHEGSCYAAQNDIHKAQFRWEHVRSRLTELEKMKAEHLSQNARQSQSMTRSVSIHQQGAAASSAQQPQPTAQPMETGAAQYCDVSST